MDFNKSVHITCYCLIWRLSFVLARWVTRVAQSNCMVHMVYVPYVHDSTEPYLSGPDWTKLQPSITQVCRGKFVQRGQCEHGERNSVCRAI